MFRIGLRALQILAWVCLAVSAAWAQNASIVGTVKDPSGAVLPNVALSLTSADKGTVRTTTSDSGGNFEFTLLDPGEYILRAEATGFKKFEQHGIVLQVDQRARLEVAMTVGSITEAVTVTGEMPLLRSEDSSVGEVIESKKIQEIPLNGRFFLDLALLVPGTVLPSTNARTFLAVPTAAGAFSFNSSGAREDQVNYLWEGINLNDMVQNQITFQPNVEMIQEFKIQSNSFSAEYGRNAGVIVNAIMKSGSNAFHGDLFEYFRNDVLDARNFFDPPRAVAKRQTGRELPPFKRNIFGASAGGPIFLPRIYDGRNRSFWFFSWESRRQRESETFNTRVLTPGERASITDPIVRQLAALIPEPNSGTQFLGSAPRIRDLDQFAPKIEQHIGSADTLTGSYIFQRDSRIEPSNIGGRNLPGFGDFRPARRQIFTLTETHVFTPYVVNEFRGGFNRVRISFLGLASSLDPAAFGLQTGQAGKDQFPGILIIGGPLFGMPGGFPQGRGDTTGQLNDTLTWTHGRHSAKFGVEFRAFHNNNFERATAGTLRFANIADFVAGRVQRFTQVSGNVDPAIRTAAFDWFVQDDWKVHPRLTLNLGLRYSFNSVPHERHNRLLVFDSSTNRLLKVGTDIDKVYANDLNNYGPRLGFAWDPLGSGKTSVRGGFGIFFDQPTTNVVTGLGANPPFRLSRDFLTVPISSLTASSGPAPTFNLNNVSRDFKSDYVLQYNLNVQHALLPGTVLQVGYFGSAGRGLRLIRDINQGIYNPATRASVRPIREFSRINTNESVSRSSYNGMWLSATRRYSRGLTFTGSYTLSKSIDLNSVGSSNPQIQDARNLAAEHALSDFDARHRFVASAVYELPFRTTGAAGKILGGWSLSGIVNLQSGNPWSPLLSQDQSGSQNFFDRPNLVGDPQTRVNPDAALDARAFALSAPGTFGNLGRNALVGPGFRNLDFALVKNTRFGPENRLNVQFRAEFFNLFNHPNLNQPSGALTYDPQTALQPGQRVLPSATFGKILSTRTVRGDLGSSRQIEFALKFFW